ncbi:hypothetical protein CFP71_40705 [Amycolatopsis thailandensis]|uniref:Regulator component n=1 Tax=Amycolatopsis thailandensis TaxID=589330 RepID=A0A229RCA5_9PSEU|nr:M48 family metallopeptidase [Amycolatopsis thailandensis]OXM44277.1 hypothetical protein CFP71_40705 [Amycolatopsis thailandensis]
MDGEMRRITAKCRAALHSLNLPERFTVGQLLAATSEKTGREVMVQEADLSGSAPFGMVLETATTYMIFYPRNTTRLHQGHIILHEDAHVLMHLSEDTGAGPSHGSGFEAVVRTLMPDLHPDLEPRVRGRTTYEDAQEREAEQFATMVQARLIAPVLQQRADEEFPAGLRALFDVPSRGIEVPSS